MKGYEGVTSTALIRRMPAIIRIDGKAFHTFTAGCDKPFDKAISGAMISACTDLYKNIQNCKIVYTQSDEISILLVDYEKLETNPWFGNNIQKIVSVASSITTASFNEHYKHPKGKMALFDARVFNLPQDEVANYFLWRQQDCIRNSISISARSLFSAKQLHGKNCKLMKEMMLEKGHDWSKIPLGYQNGFLITASDTYLEAPLIAEHRSIINDRVFPVAEKE